uniref:ATP synthase membrane subunit DAPIT, mitochondrial-like n=1 Tax=Petromyzon marinus TaxID=7757 RepID=A0AAJ7U893_PETMA|nr:ATP synthase membrane subunit DAPIT, mitochondrial-like [Petromyzon marinus]
MAGHDLDVQYQIKGIQKYLNVCTLIGRRNCVLATYATVASIVLFFKLKSKKPKQIQAS